jgi:hypothetical protein
MKLDSDFMIYLFEEDGDIYRNIYQYVDDVNDIVRDGTRSLVLKGIEYNSFVLQEDPTNWDSYETQPILIVRYKVKIDGPEKETTIKGYSAESRLFNRLGKIITSWNRDVKIREVLNEK